MTYNPSIIALDCGMDLVLFDPFSLLGFLMSSSNIRVKDKKIDYIITGISIMIMLYIQRDKSSLEMFHML